MNYLPKRGKISTFLPKVMFLKLLKTLLDKLTEQGCNKNLIARFERAGIYSLNRQKVLNQIFIPGSTSAEEAVEHLEQFFSNYVDQNERNQLQ